MQNPQSNRIDDAIIVRELAVECILGVYPRERDQPQLVLVDVELALDLNHAATHADLTHTIDYSDLAREVTFIMQASRFRLVETAAYSLLHYLLHPASPTHANTYQRPMVTSARVRLHKPFHGLRAHSFAVEMQRDFNQLTFERAILKDQIEQQHIVSTADATLFRVSQPKHAVDDTTASANTTAQSIFVLPSADPHFSHQLRISRRNH